MKPKVIQIEPVLNGYVVHVGCQRVVFESREKLILELGHYYAQPLQTEKDYLKNALNPMGEPCEPCAEQAVASPSLRSVAEVSPGYSDPTIRVPANPRR